MKLSILFPIKDRVKYLPKSIGSVLACLPELPGWDIEMIAGDDESRVAVEPIVKDLCPDIRVIRHDRDLGNMNALLAESTGDFVHFVHDDDWILPGFYTRFAAAVAESPEAEIVSIAARLYQEADGLEKSNASWFDQSGLCDGTELLKKLHFTNPLSIIGMLISRQAYRHVGLYREDLPHAGDWDMWKRLTRRPWYWCIEYLARYRIHAASATSRHQQDGSAAVDIRRSIESTLPGVETLEAYRAGSMHWVRGLLKDASQSALEGNVELARIAVDQALRILRIF